MSVGYVLIGAALGVWPVMLWRFRVMAHRQAYAITRIAELKHSLHLLRMGTIDGADFTSAAIEDIEKELAGKDIHVPWVKRQVVLERQLELQRQRMKDRKAGDDVHAR